MLCFFCGGLERRYRNMTKEKIQQIVFGCAGVLTIAGAVAQIAGVVCSSYVFAAGVLLLVCLHVKSVWQTRDDNFRMKRLARIGFLSSLMLLAACYFMFTGSNVWVVCLLIYAVVSFFLSFRSE